MFRVYLVDKKIIVYDKPEKEFRQKYGNQFEQVSVIKDQDNIDSVTEKLFKQYRCEEVIKDCHIKKKFGWGWFDEEMRAIISKSISIAKKRQRPTEEHKKAISEAKKGKPGVFRGKKHTEHTKKLMSFKQKGVNAIQGRKWMHNPITGEEKRAYELAENMIWGRSPEAREYILTARSLHPNNLKNKYKKTN